MASRKKAEIEAEPRLVEAAEKTRDLIRGLQSRLQEEARSAPRERPDETAEDLEMQLQQYFEGAGGKVEANILNEIRTRVIDGVVEKILRAWEQPQHGTPTALQNEVVE